MIEKNTMIQYILWNTCKNRCKFCYWKYSIINDDRVNNVKKVLELLDLDEVSNVGKISLMGGEIFDTTFSKELREHFYKLIDKIFLLKKRLFLMTNLIYNKDIELAKCLDYIKSIGHIKDTVICTSYDLKGRFHNADALQMYKDNCEYIKNNLDLHIEMILCSSLLDSIIDNTFSLKDFYKEYTDNVDFIPPYPGIDRKHLPNDFVNNFDFFPKRETYFRFLKKCFLQDNSLKPNNFLNRNFHSNILYYFIDGKYVKDIDRQDPNNMQQDQYNYSDDFIHSMTNDYLEFREIYNF